MRLSAPMLRRLTVLAIFTGGVPACGDANGPVTSVAGGRYGLVAVDGVPLPIRAERERHTEDWVADTIEFARDGSLRQTRTNVETPVGGTTSYTKQYYSVGDYAQSGDTVSLHYFEGGFVRAGRAVVRGRTLTMGPAVYNRAR